MDQECIKSVIKQLMVLSKIGYNLNKMKAKYIIR